MEFLRDPIWQFIGVIVTIAIAASPIFIRKIRGLGKTSPNKTTQAVLPKTKEPELTTDLKNDKIEEILHGLRDLGSADTCYLNVGVFSVSVDWTPKETGIYQPNLFIARIPYLNIDVKKKHIRKLSNLGWENGHKMTWELNSEYWTLSMELLKANEILGLNIREIEVSLEYS